MKNYIWVPAVVFILSWSFVLACGTDPDLSPPVEVPVDSVDVPVPDPEPDPVEADTTEDVALECPIPEPCPDCPDAAAAVFEFTEHDLTTCFDDYDLGFQLCAVR